MNDYLDDDAFQRERRDALLRPLFYDRWFPYQYRFVTDRDMQGQGIDTVLMPDGGIKMVRIDEKIVRWPGYRYRAFSLETRSCTVAGFEKPGWMFSGEADILLYCFARPDDALSCWWIDMAALQKWFWPKEQTFAPFRMSEHNQTMGRVVLIQAVQLNIPHKHFLLRKRSPNAAAAAVGAGT
jgi:hypothetical protein